MGNYQSGTFAASMPYLSGVAMTRALPVVATGLAMVLYLGIRACCRRHTPLRRTMTRRKHLLLMALLIFFMMTGMVAVIIGLTQMWWLLDVLNALPKMFDPIAAASNTATGAAMAITNVDLSVFGDSGTGLQQGCDNIGIELEGFVSKVASVLTSQHVMYDGIVVGGWAALEGIFGVTLICIFGHGIYKALSVRGRKGACCKVLSLSVTIAMVVMVFFLFLFAGVFLSVATVTADFCADTTSSLTGIAGESEFLTWYLGCEGVSPFAQLEQDIGTMYRGIEAQIKEQNVTYGMELSQTVAGVMENVEIIFEAINCTTINRIIKNGIGLVCGDLYSVGVLMWILCIVAGSAVVLLRHVTFKLPKSEMSSALRVDDILDKGWNKGRRGVRLIQKEGFAIEKDAKGETNLLLPNTCYCDAPAYQDLYKNGYTIDESKRLLIGDSAVMMGTFSGGNGKGTTVTLYATEDAYLTSTRKPE